MAVRGVDVEYAFDDPDEGWFGMARPAEAGPERPVEQATPDDVADEADTDRWLVQDTSLAEPVVVETAPPVPAGDRPVLESVAASLNVVPTRRSGFYGASTSSSWQTRLSNSGAWDFRAKSGRAWYRSTAAVMAAAIGTGVLAIVGVVFVLRSPAGDGSPPVTPSESAAPSAPTTSAPAPSSSEVPLPPPPPPGPPPPPPPSAEQVSPPVVTRQYTPNYQSPDEPKKPQTNVTRAPLSATPPPPPQPTDRGRATPGESGHHGFFG